MYTLRCDSHVNSLNCIHRKAEKTFMIEAQKKFDDFVKQKMKTMEKKMDIIGSLV